jgi:SpoIID/LytB domain protein
MKRLVASLLLIGLLLPGASALAAPAEVLRATYTASPPAQVSASTPFTLAVTLANSGSEPWNSTGPQPINLGYHWIDSGGTTVVWDGARTPLGGDVLPGAQRTVQAVIQAPANPGSYFLLLALVQEGVGWLPPSAPYPVAAITGYAATFGQVTLPTFITGVTYQMNVPVTNTGTVSWPAQPSPPGAVPLPQVTLSYHWHDATGKTIVWDGRRSPLPANVDPQGSVTVNATVVAPSAPCGCVLTFDLVREGVAWFGQLGSTPLRLPSFVAPVTYAAVFGAPATAAAYYGEGKTLTVTVTNTGNVPWNATGPNPVSLSYHLFGPTGNAIIWDGPRTPLTADVAPGASATFSISYVAPSKDGTYVIAIDLVREGISWFQFLGSQPFRQSLVVTSGLAAGYGATTTPQQATISATLQLTVQVSNYGQRTWTPGAFSLGYHIFKKNGDTVLWDGARGVLPGSVPPFATVSVPVSVALPGTTGDYVLAWDMVQEGVAWFSQLGVARKAEAFSVVPGVTFFGSGFGHGLGMSQYGANGYASGAAGPAMTGEQIVAKYYPGTTLQFVDPSRSFNRVLLSAPSSQGRFVCGDNRYFDGTLADLSSTGGIRVLNEGAANAVIAQGGGGQNFQIVARGGVLEVWQNFGTPSRAYAGAGPVTVTPVDASQPIKFDQKGGTYRGNLRFSYLGGTLRVINAVSYDDYVRGVLPLEMPTSWHPEALKAQAYAARTYSYSSYKGGSRDYDVTDDQADQCYGGTRVEVPASNLAVNLTLGKVITFQGASIRAYFASSSGGYTLNDGCWMNNVVRSGGSWVCSAGSPYLAAVPDPGDRLVATPANPRASWTVTFTSDQIRSGVLRCGGPDIGVLQGVDVSNQVPAGVGHVISVRVFGSAANADLRADDLLRSCLGLRSTMVRLNPF